jgi:hypothetical protein
MTTPAPEPFDLDALRQAIEVAVRKALDTPEFHGAVDAAVARFLAGVGQQARADDVALQIRSAVVAPVWREVMGADDLPEGTTDPLRAVQESVGDVGGQIDGALRDAVERATKQP